MVVRPHQRTDNYIDVCSEFGEVLCTISRTQWFYIIKPIRVDNRSVYVFNKDGNNIDLYSIYKKRFHEIKSIVYEKKKG